MKVGITVLLFLLTFCVTPDGVLLVKASTPSANPTTGVSSLLYDLDYDENQRLDGYYVLYEPSPSCTAAGLQKFRHARYKTLPARGKAASLLFDDDQTGNDSDSNACRAVCLQRGVHVDLVASVMPHLRYQGQGAQDWDDFFTKSCSQVESCFMNYYDKEQPITLYWIRPETGEKVHHLEIF